MRKIPPRYAHDMPKLCLRYAQDLTKSQKRYALSIKYPVNHVNSVNSVNSVNRVNNVNSAYSVSTLLRDDTSISNGIFKAKNTHFDPINIG